MSITVKAVARSFGDRMIFSNVSFQLGHGEHVALIGRNGSGKSTLMRIIAGQDTPDAGSATVQGRLALLEQQTAGGSGDVLTAVIPDQLAKAKVRLQSAEAALADPDAEALTEYGAAEEDFRLLGGYEFEARAAAVLAGLDLDPQAQLDRLSGGQQRRALLAALLLTPADVLLLDEPTNHLDASSREWLEDWVKESPATILLVSHDRVFLDRSVSRVLELERGSLNDWPGNYSQAMALKQTAQAAQERAYQSQERQKSQLRAESGRLGSISRSSDKFSHKRAGNVPLITAKGKAENVSRTLARRARALDARIERMNEVERPWEDRLTVSIPLPEVPAGPGEVLELKDFGMRRGGRQLFSGLDFSLRRGEKVALTGPNGSGKTSLLKTIMGELAHDGQVVLGHGLSVFHAWQHGEELEGFGTLADAVLAAQPDLRRQDLHHLLGQLQLPGPDHAVADLSGGQRTRLALARLAVTRASLLVLDEPTNNLDLEAIEALEQLLLDYPGTVLVSSHDRRLVERVATRVWNLGIE